MLRDASGAPTGELQEMAAMMAAIKAVAADLVSSPTDAAQFYNFARVAQARGVTTIVDGGGSTFFEPAFLAAALAATGAADFPARIVAHNNGITVAAAEDMIKFAAMLEGKGNDKLVFQGIKILLDGSNQGFTGRLRPLGYLGSGANGLWNCAPDELRQLVPALHNAGLQIVAHCNADQATAMFIEAVALAQAQRPRFDHRHFIVARPAARRVAVAPYGVAWDSRDAVLQPPLLLGRVPPRPHVRRFPGRGHESRRDGLATGDRGGRPQRHAGVAGRPVADSMVRRQPGHCGRSGARPAANASAPTTRCA